MIVVSDTSYGKHQRKFYSLVLTTGILYVSGVNIVWQSEDEKYIIDMEWYRKIKFEDEAYISFQMSAF